MTEEYQTYRMSFRARVYQIIRQNIKEIIRMSEEPPTKMDVVRKLEDIGAKTVFNEINKMLDEGELELVDTGYSTKGLRIKEPPIFRCYATDCIYFGTDECPSVSLEDMDKDGNIICKNYKLRDKKPEDD